MCLEMENDIKVDLCLTELQWLYDLKDISYCTYG